MDKLFDEKLISNAISSMVELSGILSISIPISFMFMGVKNMKKIVYEETIKGLNKKDLLDYLVQNRIFIGSLSDEDIKYYFKTFKLFRRQRLKRRIKQFFYMLSRPYLNIKAK